MEFRSSHGPGSGLDENPYPVLEGTVVDPEQKLMASTEEREVSQDPLKADDNCKSATRSCGCFAAKNGARALARIAKAHEPCSIVQGARLRSRLLRWLHSGCVRGVSECISGSRQRWLFPGLCKQAAAQLTLLVTQDGIDLNKNIVEPPLANEEVDVATNTSPPSSDSTSPYATVLL